MEKNSTKSNIKKPIDLKKLNPIYNIDVRPATSYQPNYFFGDKKMYGKGSIDFDVILNNGVKLQRNFVWKLEQKQDLIIGMLCGTKLPPFYVILYVDDTKGQTHRELKFKIIDGKQRLSTIRDFMEGKFGIPFEEDLYYFDDLTEIQQYQINCYSLNFHIVYEYMDALLGDEVYVKLFNFVNFGGTPQERKHMTMLEESLKK